VTKDRQGNRKNTVCSEQ